MRHFLLSAWSEKRQTNGRLGNRKKFNFVLWINGGAIPKDNAFKSTVNLKTQLKSLSTLKPRITTMLVLSRKESEKIMLGDEIVLTIVRVSGDRVRLGIQAPKDMLILRHELESQGLKVETNVSTNSTKNSKAA